MGKSTFAKHFQNNIAKSIETLLSEWDLGSLSVSTKDSILPGAFNGIMDICIYDENNLENVLAIEIEHKSSFEQAKRNIEKMKEWTHRSPNRKCSLLQVFNEECNIKPHKINQLVIYAKENQHKNYGFYYDFIFYSVDDLRKTSETAENLSLSADFRTRLWILLNQIALA